MPSRSPSTLCPTNVCRRLSKGCRMEKQGAMTSTNVTLRSVQTGLRREVERGMREPSQCRLRQIGRNDHI